MLNHTQDPAVTVTIRQADGSLVRQFTTNSRQFADEQIAMWRGRFAGEDLAVTEEGSLASGKPDTDAALQAAVAAFDSRRQAAALRLIADGKCEPTGIARSFKVTSERDDSRWYLTDQYACSCPDSQPCKHQCAVIMRITAEDLGIWQDSQPEPAGGALIEVPDYQADKRAWDLRDWAPADVTVAAIVAAVEGVGGDEDQVRIVTAGGEPLRLAAIHATDKPDLVWLIVDGGGR